jgi:hypothetical protein
MRQEIIGLLAVLALVLAGYREVAFGGKTFDTSALTIGVNGYDAATAPKVNAFRVDPGASAWQMTPWARVIHREIAQGRLPVWNPYEGAGSPLAGNLQSAVFDPLSSAVNLHPTILTSDLTFLVAFLLAGLAMYLFLRNLGLSLLSSIAGAGAFVLSGYFATDNNLSFARLYLYLPVLFLLVDKVVASGKARWVGLLGVAVAGTILGGMPEVTFCILIATAIYALYRLLRGAADGNEETSGVVAARAGSRPAVAVRLGVGVIFGLFLAAPLLILFVGYLPLSLNQHGPGAGMGAASRATLLNWLIPFVNGYPAALRVPRFGPDRSWIGAAGGVLLVAACAAPTLMRRRAGWLFLGLGSVLLLKIHGFPGLQLIGKLPVFNRVNFVAFGPPVVSFCFAVVVAIALDALVSGAVRPRRLLWGAGALGALTAFLLVLNRPVLTVPPHLSPWRQYLLYAVAMGAGGVVLLACITSVWLPRLRRFAAPAAAATLLVELLVFFAPGAYAPRTDPYTAPPWLETLASHLASDPQGRVLGLDRTLYPDIAGAFAIQDVRALDALYPKRYATFVGTFVSSFTDRFTGESATPADIEANPMLDLLGVRYVLAGTTPVDQGTGQFRQLVAGPVSVVENTHALPRAFVATDIHRVSSQSAAVSYLRGLGHRLADGRTRIDGFDPRTQAVVEVSGPATPLPSGEAGTPRTVTISSYGPDEVIVDVAPGSPGLLVLTDTYMPGWQATVDGRAASVLPTDVAFRGVALGGGATRVVFRYRPPGATLMWLLPLVGLLGFGVWWLVRRRGVSFSSRHVADTATQREKKGAG